jgi:hypothetical protein
MLAQIDAQEAERACLARELHDNVGQRLAMISIDAELIKQGLPASEKLALRSVENHLPRRTRSFVFYEVFSVISVPPWLIFIPMGGPQTHVILRITRGHFSNG